MSISLNALNDKINSMGIEIWQETWFPREQSVHNSYTVKRTDYDFCIGFAIQWNLDGGGVGQSAPIMLGKNVSWKGNTVISFYDFRKENFYLTSDDGKVITPAETDSIWRINLVFFKFNGLLKLYYSFSYNIIYKATHLLEKIFLCLKQRRCE